MECLTLDGVLEQLRMVLTQVFGRTDEEPGGTACRVADAVGRLGRRQVNHEFDDVTRRAELTGQPSRRQLAKHVLVEVTVSVALVHRHVVQKVHDLRQQGRRWDGEPRVLHVVREGGVVPADLLTELVQIREHLVPHRPKHLLGRLVAQSAPAQILLAWQEHGVLDRPARDDSLSLCERL